MTLEQIAADIVGKQCDTDACTDRREDRCDCTQAIATALREARNQALEEAALWHDEREKELERAAKGYERVGLHDFYRADLRHAIEHGLSAKHFRALKHKDGQS